jgi:hypothetical protein
VRTLTHRPGRCLALAAAIAAVIAATPPGAEADQVINDDLIVTGSECIGFDCVSGEFFSADTLKLKENNTRLLFDDTSAEPGYAATDWRLTANEQPIDGANQFSIDDVTAGTIPFLLEAGLPTGSLFVGEAGVGMGTTSPDQRLHLVDDNTPSIQFEQTDAAGFSPHEWRIGANEANFLVQDLKARTLPFRVETAAPDLSLNVTSSGNVGFGLREPEALIHVHTPDAQLRIEERTQPDAEPTPRVLADLVNLGPSSIRFQDTSPGGSTWLAGGSGQGDFSIRTQGDSGPPAMRLTTLGGLVTAGALEQRLDAASLADAQPVDADSILQATLDLPLSTWTYDGDSTGARHLGPTAEAFADAFGLGAGGGAIAPADLAGVSLAGVQALARDANARDERIARLAEGLEALGADPAAGALRADLDALSGRVGAQEQRLQSTEGAVAGLTATNRELKQQNARLAKRNRLQTRRLNRLATQNRYQARKLKRLHRRLTWVAKLVRAGD